MKTPRIAELVAIGMISMMGASASAFAQSDQTHGGGEIVNRPGYKELRDLLDQTTCDWKSNEDIFQAAPALSNILKKVAALDWYFAFDLERQIRSLNWCFTGNLIRVNTEDRDQLTVSQDYNTTQAAIRMLDGDDVYVDSNLFFDPSISPETKAYLVIHETIHSYLAIDEDQRNNKLRSTVKSISNVVSGKINTREKLYLQLRQNDIEFPLATNELDPYKNYILFVLGSSEQRLQVLSETSDVDQLFQSAKHLPEFATSLTTEDQGSFIQYTLSDAIQEICSSNDSELVQALLSKPSVGEDATMACLSAAKDNATLRNQIIELPSFQGIMAGIVQKMTTKKFSIQEYRLMVSAAVEMMSASDSFYTDTVFTALTPVNNFNWAKLNSKGAGFYNYVRTLIDNNNWDELNSKILQNDAFYQAFSFGDLKAQLATMDTPIKREKETATEMLDEVPTGYWTTFISMLSRDTGVDNASRFKAALDLKKLGINI